MTNDDPSSSPAPPPLPRLDDDEMRLTNFVKPQLHPESIESQSRFLGKSGVQSVAAPSTPIEQPIIMPVMMPQAIAHPYQQQSVPDRPLTVTVNANSKAEENNNFARDHRICYFCKRGIMTKKKDWLRVVAILLVSMLCPPLSFIFCFFLCTRIIYYRECSSCHRISKRAHRVF
ncbi:unnamed protein product [Litomosoides sigmodontis]|uniref:LITAF domain-containing protein n=1 Tax=Litomosoides sigmodontis TaxID=42156 RepID=A0A3P6S6Y9_LITSI|nr:unnamed protein product [Litomosoides sigmodontis]